MKMLPISKALNRLNAIRERLRDVVRTEYEPKAKDCLTCEVMGACCTDEHFVNVRVTRLEGEAIRRAVEELPEPVRSKALSRASSALKLLNRIAPEGSAAATYSCPLFDPATGCLVHDDAKPLPCIQHACYEKKEDLPPDSLLQNAERKVARLNSRVYGSAWSLEPIPRVLAPESGDGDQAA